MVDAESTQSNDALASAPAAPVSDWSNVRGFQVVAAASPEPDASAADADAHTRELAKELSVRAARFSQSVDDSVVLASDGVIRWLGDPVARLIAGDDLLRPRAVLLADEALSEESRAAVQTRLDLWLSAHVSKVLGPLQALAEPGAVAEPVRTLANRVSQALGVLERERVRQQVKTLDQSARSALRKLGVRFGSMYIFVPALLKPGARTLCSQLWGLRRGEAGAERLLAFAAAGRTSFAAEAPLAADTYRVAGFRLCGERVVRIDIVERLNDLIRAAIPDHMRPGGRPASDASGFVVSAQMTSLTGCAGEAFASILRSLGYESHRVKKSDFEAATRKPAATSPIETAPLATAAEEAAAGEVGDAESSAAGSTVDDAHEPEPLTGAVGATSVIEAAESPLAPTSSEHATAFEAEPDLVETDPTELIAADESALPVVEEAAEATEAGEPTSATSPDEIGPDAVEAAEPGRAPDAMESGLADSIEAPPTGPVDEGERATPEVVEPGVAASSPEEDEWIEVWRPAPRRRPAPAPHPAASAPSGESEAARPPRHSRDPRRRWTRDGAPRPESSDQRPASAETPAAAAAETPAPVAAEGPRGAPRHEGGAPHRQERGRRHFQKGARAEELRASEPTRGGKDTPNVPTKKEHRPAPVDMDSPFAKLLALKPLLERRDKRT